MKDSDTDSQVELECTQGWWYFVVDGDNIGNEAAVPLLRDQEKQASAVSRKIHAGQEVIQAWVDSEGGEMILEGGDNAVFKIECNPDDDWDVGDVLDDLEVLRSKYEDETGFTLSVGMGNSPSTANKSLLVAKERGKDQSVVYDESVEEEYLEILDKVARDTEFIQKKSGQLALPEAKKGRFRPSKENAALSKKTFDLYNSAETKSGWPRSGSVHTYAKKVASRKSMDKRSAERLLSLLKRSKRNGTKSGDRAVKLLGGASLVKPLEKFLQGEYEE